MTFSLQIANGDLVMQGSQLGIVYGIGKLRQDLTLWMLERFNIDRFHPSMGSNFQNYIGGIIGYGTQSMVYAEAMRVLDNYQRVQFQGFRQAPQLYSLSELLWSIDAVDIGVGYDTVNVAVKVSNGLQQPTALQIAQGA